MVSTEEVSCAEFERRLTHLCVGDERNMPRKRRDREVLLKAASLRFAGGKTYTEQEVNQHLAAWLAEIGRPLRTDHVTLRRYLVDHGYLERSPAGDRYFVLERAALSFAREIAEVDQQALVDGSGASGQRRRVGSGN